MSKSLTETKKCVHQKRGFPNENVVCLCYVMLFYVYGNVN